MLTEKRYKKALTFFLCIYPIFSLKIFYNNVFTLIQIMFISLFVIWNLTWNKEAQRKIKYIFIYFILLAIYAIFHHLNALNFQSFTPAQSRRSSRTRPRHQVFRNQMSCSGSSATHPSPLRAQKN